VGRLLHGERLCGRRPSGRLSKMSKLQSCPGGTACPRSGPITVAGGAQARSARHPRSAIPHTESDRASGPIFSFSINTGCSMTSVIFGTEASMTAELDGTACAVRAIWGMVDRGCLALRASAPPATAIGPLRGRGVVAAHCSMRKCRNSRGRFQRPSAKGFSPGLARPGASAIQNYPRPAPAFRPAGFSQPNISSQIDRWAVMWGGRQTLLDSPRAP
jgi:hypothetical protein